MEGKPFTVTNTFPAPSLAKVAISSQHQEVTSASTTSAVSKDAFVIRRVAHITANTTPAPVRAATRPSSTSTTHMPSIALVTSAPLTGATTKPSLSAATAPAMRAHTDHATNFAWVHHSIAFCIAAGTKAASTRQPTRTPSADPIPVQRQAAGNLASAGVIISHCA